MTTKDSRGSAVNKREVLQSKERKKNLPLRLQIRPCDWWKTRSQCSCRTTLGGGAIYYPGETVLFFFSQ